ncbi:hypothetical protein EKO04_008780 [Ascochyta lentis]|uniref:BZIP domain-containing protein n=1 Tax=Ascochyta lentis TaxID=205686 RepID=A0A8H7IZZ3_9PLEO|nr:hypothetical protein EKO04_008780 [Ascochyta lentis]
MASKAASICVTADRWAPSPLGDYSSMTMADYVGFPVVSPRLPGNQFVLQPAFEQSNTTDHDLHSKVASKRSFTDFDTHSDINTTSGVSTAATHSWPAIFTASNAHAQTNAYNSATISPLDTRFDLDHASPSSDSKFSTDRQSSRAGSSNFMTFTENTDSSPSKRRCDSLQSNFAAHSPIIPQAQVGRRRGSEYAEPGSARAVYLEKNRKAASKCRSKQKRQQEELVETARDVERRNKILKAEVEFLKSGIQDLMQLVGQHTNCPDSRLKLYLQREADRLAVGGQRTVLISPSSGSPYSGTGSIDKNSSPEEG